MGAYIKNLLFWLLAVMLNSCQIFEKIFGDELIMDIIGSLECKFHCSVNVSLGDNLEYLFIICCFNVDKMLDFSNIFLPFADDPEVPCVQHHRNFLKEHVVFKEVTHCQPVLFFLGWGLVSGWGQGWVVEPD